MYRFPRRGTVVTVNDHTCDSRGKVRGRTREDPPNRIWFNWSNMDDNWNSLWTLTIPETLSTHAYMPKCLTLFESSLVSPLILLWLLPGWLTMLPVEFDICVEFPSNFGSSRLRFGLLISYTFINAVSKNSAQVLVFCILNWLDTRYMTDAGDESE